LPSVSLAPSRFFVLKKSILATAARRFLNFDTASSAHSSCSGVRVRPDGAEEPLDLGVAEAIDEGGPTDRRLAAPLDDLTEDPLEVLHALLGLGEDVHGVLDRHGADARQAPPDLHPEIVGLGRNLMNEEQPGLSVESL
jgi:hypothetical protein